jgi:hypothetical protein
MASASRSSGSARAKSPCAIRAVPRPVLANARLGCPGDTVGSDAPAGRLPVRQTPDGIRHYPAKARLGQRAGGQERSNLVEERAIVAARLAQRGFAFGFRPATVKFEQRSHPAPADGVHGHAHPTTATSPERVALGSDWGERLGVGINCRICSSSRPQPTLSRPPSRRPRAIDRPLRA